MENPSKTKQPGDVTIHVTGEVRSQSDALVEFCREHPNWLDHWAADGPVYCLPPKAIVGLQRPLAKRRALLEEDGAAIETSFTKLCRDFKAFGYWMGRFATSAFVVRPDPLPPVAQLRAPPLSWTRAWIRQAEQLVAKADSAALRLRGYIGWLITEPEFTRSRDELFEQWFALKPKHRPFPIQRAVKVARRKGAKHAPAKVARFQRALDEFLDRWGLMRMMT